MNFNKFHLDIIEWCSDNELNVCNIPLFFCNYFNLEKDDAFITAKKSTLELLKENKIILFNKASPSELLPYKEAKVILEEPNVWDCENLSTPSYFIFIRK